MSLRLQLMVLSLLTLVIPWAGCQYVKEMEGALRGGLEQSQLASVRTIAASVRDTPELLYDNLDQLHTRAAPGSIVYAHKLAATPRIDGYRDDWGLAGAISEAIGSSAHRYSAATDNRYLYLFLDIIDNDLRYEAPGERPGDRVFVALHGAPQQPVKVLVLATSAPGALGARLADGRLAPTNSREDRVFGAWVETRQGVNVEVRLPLDLARHGLGLGFVDVDGPAHDQVGAVRNWPPGAPPGPVKYARRPLENALAELRPRGARLRVVDRDGFVLADLGSVAALARPDRITVAERLYRLVLTTSDPRYESFDDKRGRLDPPELERTLSGEPRAWWLKLGSSASAIVLAAAPVTYQDSVIGAVLLEQASEGILTLTNRALTRLMNATLLASLVAALTLLAFATFLSFRVRRLAHAARQALSPKGEIQTRLPGANAGDELGDLTRSFGDLLGRLDAYTGYLKGLSGKLSHELRTPIAVVTTSAENLETEVQSDAARVFLGRLRQGAARLEHIVASMSEATRIEQAVQDTPRRPFALTGLVEQCVASYQSVHPGFRFSFVSNGEPARVVGSPELMAQLLDKLIDNAVEFTPEGGRIQLRLQEVDGWWRLTVANEGPALPEGMHDQLFESLVSVRTRRTERPHLGLGLYIVRLIAEFHGGRVTAANSEDPPGCAFSVLLPGVP